MPDLQSFASGDLSVIDLFMAADWVVKAILITLLLMSVASWAIILSRALVLRRERQQTASLESVLQLVGNVDDLEQLCNVNSGGASRALHAIYLEWHWSHHNRAAAYSVVADRLRSVARLSVHTEARRLLGRTTLLASIGSSAPFIGLFGTVWGIMRSFIAIGELEAVTIAVVAPGISEALFATAVGLFTAIPAVIAYNRLAQAANDLNQRWYAICEQIEIAISRYYSSGN